MTGAKLRHAQEARAGRQATVDALKLKLVAASEMYLNACADLAAAEVELAEAEAHEARQFEEASSPRMRLVPKEGIA